MELDTGASSFGGASAFVTDVGSGGRMDDDNTIADIVGSISDAIGSIWGRPSPVYSPVYGSQGPYNGGWTPTTTTLAPAPAISTQTLMLVGLAVLLVIALK